MRLVFLLSLLLFAASCMAENADRDANGAGVRIALAGAGVAPMPAHLARLADDQFVARDGAVLPLRHWLPATPPRAVILALHGFNDYSQAFADVGPAWAEQGIATYAYDQRGFGRGPDRGLWAGSGRLIEDAATIASLLRRQYPGVPIYLLGESMGGAVAVVAAARHEPALEVDGLILVAPAVWGRETMNLFERIGLWLANLLPSVAWSPDLLPVTIVPSDNGPMLDALAADPLVIKNTRADALNGLVDLMSDALAAGRRVALPALILYGERDQLVPREPVARLVASLPAQAAARQRVAVYPAGYHMLLRDLEGPLVIDDIAHWVTDRAAPLPSGADRTGRAWLLQPQEPQSAAQLSSPSRPSVGLAWPRARS